MDRALAHAYGLVDLKAYPAIRLPIEMERARVAAEARPGASGGGNVGVAEHRLENIIQTAKQLMLYQIEIEARLALCEVEAKTDPTSARVHSQALEKYAAARGFALIAHKAVELEKNYTGPGG